MISEGFKLIEEADVWAMEPVEIPNYKSVLDHRYDVVDNIIMNDIKNGWVIPWPRKPHIVTARGAVPKPHQINEWRIITDLSKPRGNSVNNLRKPPKFTMSTFDCAVRLTKKGYWVAKVDLKSAYRHVAIHPENWELYGFEWNGEYWIDRQLCFGLNFAPWVFTQFTDALVWLAKKRGIRWIIGYIDDFLIVAETKEECQAAYDSFCNLLAELGFSRSPSKCIEPCQCLEFLGITLDTTIPEARLSPEKKEAISTLVSSFLVRDSASARELQSLAGVLNNACKVVHGGRTFLRRVIDLIKTADTWSEVLPISESMKLNLVWWRDFAALWDGKAIFIDPTPVSPLQFQTDACKTVGCGGFFNGKYFQYRWDELPEEIRTYHINTLEVLPVLLAARIWGSEWRGRHVVAWVDNKPAVSVFNFGSSDNPVIMGWLRELFALSAEHNFRITARHLPGRINVLADRLSR